MKSRQMTSSYHASSTPTEDQPKGKRTIMQEIHHRHKQIKKEKKEKPLEERLYKKTYYEIKAQSEEEIVEGKTFNNRVERRVEELN